MLNNFLIFFYKFKNIEKLYIDLYSINKINNERNKISSNINNDINNIDEFDKIMKNYFLANKDKNIKPKNFINYGNILYNKYNLNILKLRYFLF